MEGIFFGVGTTLKVDGRASVDPVFFWACLADFTGVTVTWRGLDAWVPSQGQLVPLHQASATTAKEAGQQSSGETDALTMPSRP